MSDCFDHEMDACNDHINRTWEDGGDDHYFEGQGVRLKAKVITETTRAVLLEFGEGFDVTRRWVPESQLRRLEADHVIISNWMFNKLF